ncbi:sensor histidine kinase [Lichenifustis flavocetrariae]|uniref:histidine kinase n=1 Tax=Lichenifustis flavocetrariae TaxID=2949735 RepID=A0AA41YZ69_9HYPH|nr:HAMP domain-containing sensor histidine kinase [Lichenifustis flavocetrariae]MCW6507568.1 HAMP domain-containing histidine kinase [Lichenifustis flavocetrariae]
MRVLPRSLSGRLLATGGIFILLALLATGLAVDLALHRFVRGQIDQRLDGQLMTIAAALESQQDGTIALTRNVDGPPFDNPRTGWFWLARTESRVWHSAGLRLADVKLSSPRTEPPPEPFHRPQPLEGRGPGERDVEARTDDVSIGGHTVTLIAAAPTEAQTGPLRDALVPVSVSLLVLGLGLMAATLLQVRVGLRPLDALRRSLSAVRAGALDRLPTIQPAEVRPLVAEMNSLLDENAANLERARRHVANLAHALKTPLATLTLALDVPGRDPDHDLRRLAIAMDRRIRHHLARARAAALGAGARTSLPLAARIADHTDAFAKIYADKHVTCRVAINGDLAVACDPQDLDEMVGNILDNAFKWSHGEIVVEAMLEGRTVALRIDDDGPGVASDKLAAVMMPGRRLDETMPGDGFGLAIAQELTELYGGGLALARSSLGGLSVTLMLPAARAGEEAAE